MKFRAHDTFAIRKGWLHKGMKHILKNPRLFVDKNINPMDELGIGSNMVKALRYWLQAFGLTIETGATTKKQEFTELGKLIWNNDLFNFSSLCNPFCRFAGKKFNVKTGKKRLNSYLIYIKRKEEGQNPD